MRLTQLRWVFSGTVLAVLLTVGCSGPEDSSRGEGTVADRVAAVLDRSGAFQSVRAVVVTVDGDPVFEEYYGSTGEDYHDVHSVTKSVMSILIGIAISEGAIAGVDATLGDLLRSTRRAWHPGSRARRWNRC